MKAIETYAVMTLVKKSKLKHQDLIKLCEECGVDTDGPRTRLIARLDLTAAAQFPEKATVVTTRYAGAATRCPSCGFAVMVNGTNRKKMDGGQTLITRAMKCLGPDNHKYPLKDIVTHAVAKKEPVDDRSDDTAPVKTAVVENDVKSEKPVTLKKEPQKQAKKAV